VSDIRSQKRKEGRRGLSSYGGEKGKREIREEGNPLPPIAEDNRFHMEKREKEHGEDVGGGRGKRCKTA